VIARLFSRLSPHSTLLIFGLNLCAPQLIAIIRHSLSIRSESWLEVGIRSSFFPAA
jgi:hypothetical protein